MTPTTPRKSPAANAKVAQPKMATGTAATRKTPSAPAVYRPVEAPKVLQLKSAAAIQLKPCKHGKNKRTCPHCRQSQQDRNTNRFLEYQTPNKKTINQDIQNVRNLNTNLAHGTGNKQSGKSGKTETILEGVNNQRQNPRRRNK
ncbi:MAG TPA: hypothetical protein VHH35_14365 [Pyrinomonadaceae bacterium]|nr:hypothetical protein [Pyrinomonadaceae bacterium]